MEKLSESVLVETRPGQCTTHGDFVSSALFVRNRVLHWTDCPACARTEARALEESLRQEQLRVQQTRLEARLQKAGIPERYRSKGLESYTVQNEGEARVMVQAQAWLQRFKERKQGSGSLVFSGAPGTGKSHLALALGLEVMKSATVIYLTAPDLVRMVRSTWRPDTTQSEAALMRELGEAGLLIIDEIGSQHVTDSMRLILFDVIDKRYRDMRPMVLVSNLNRKELEVLLGERSFDRLRESAIWAVFDWGSRRGAPAVMP